MKTVSLAAAQAALLASVLLVAACEQDVPATPSPVQPGVEVLLSTPLPAVLQGKRVGLITNHTGQDSRGESAVDLLHRADGFELVAIFAPEHGIRGTVADGDAIAAEVDQQTGLPIHSLYGETRTPTPEMLEGIEALIFDIQDIGARQYTYMNTMSYAMGAAAAHGIPFVVLDRPNPVGAAIIEGSILDTAFSTFVGLHPIPFRHGLTMGELAQLFNEEFSIGADLTIVPVSSWTRDLYYDETGLPWVNPSPNIRSLDAAIHFPGTVLFEGTNLTEGRGTNAPFEKIGASWLDAPAVVDEMTAMGLPGVRFEPITIQVEPGARKFPGEAIPGIRLVVADRTTYRPARMAVLLIDAIRRRHPDDFAWSPTMDRLSGTDQVRSAVENSTVQELLETWASEEARWEEIRQPYLLYP